MTPTATPPKAIRLRVHYKTPQSVIGEFTRSIGNGNVALESPKALPLGTRFVFELKAQGVNTLVEVVGEVVEVIPADEGRFKLSIRYDRTQTSTGAIDEMLQRIFDAHRFERMRKHPRIPIHVRATGESPGSPTYLVRDVSLGGIGIEVEAPTAPRTLQVGAPFFMELGVSFGTLQLHGEVSWVYRPVKSAAGPHPTFGVAFGKLRPDTAKWLEQILALRSLPPPPWKALLSLGMEAVSRMP